MFGKNNSQKFYGEVTEWNCRNRRVNWRTSVEAAGGRRHNRGLQAQFKMTSVEATTIHRALRKKTQLMSLGVTKGTQNLTAGLKTKGIKSKVLFLSRIS